MYLKNLLLNWNICRFVRITAGLLILVTGIVRYDWPSIGFGILFLAAGLFSTQCCSTGGCDVTYRKDAATSKSID